MPYCQHTSILDIRNGVSQGFGRRGRVRGGYLSDPDILILLVIHSYLLTL
jgi:hypothetical protein